MRALQGRRSGFAARSAAPRPQVEPRPIADPWRLSTWGFITLCASRLGHQPIAKRLHAGPLQGTLWINHVIGEAGRKAEFERPHQPACGKVVGNQAATAEHDALAPDCSLDRVIVRQKRRTAVRVDIIDPGAVQPYNPIDSENVI